MGLHVVHKPGLFVLKHLLLIGTVVLLAPHTAYALNVTVGCMGAPGRGPMITRLLGLPSLRWIPT